MKTKIIRFLRSYGLLIVLIANIIAVFMCNGMFSFSKYVNEIGLVRELVSPYKLYIDEKTKIYYCVLLCTYKQSVPKNNQPSLFKIITIDKSKIFRKTSGKDGEFIHVYADRFETLRDYDIKPYEFNEGLSADNISERVAYLRDITDKSYNTGSYLDKDNNADILVDLRIWSDVKRQKRNQEYSLSQALYVISVPFDVVTLPIAIIQSLSGWKKEMQGLTQSNQSLQGSGPRRAFCFPLIFSSAP